VYNFQGHRRLSEQLLETPAAIRKPKQALWRGLLEGFLQLVNAFIEAERNFILDLLQKKTAKNSETISAHSKSKVLILGPSKNIQLVICGWDLAE
jgi:hypothetical protein